MLLVWMQALQAQQAQAYPSYFNPVVLLLLVLGALGWLVAAVLGFSRARAAGPAARWFALAAACMLLFHLHILLIGIAGAGGAVTSAVALTAFVPLFVVLASACAILGFTRSTTPEP
jgi:TRAP-type C4-dicarboxylate transport system permease large subunit